MTAGLIGILGLTLLLAPCVVLDVRKKKLPVIWLLLFLPVSFAVNLLVQRVSLWAMIFGVLYGGLFLCVSLAAKGSIGFGDGIMIGSAGALQGGMFVLMSSFTGFLFAGVFGLIYIKVKKLDRKTRLPFAPFFAAACLLLSVPELFTGGSG